jgi:thymidine phosphorylase
VRGVGDAVGPDAPLALIHGRDEATIAAAAKRLRDAYITGSEPPPAPRAIHERIA